ncbi:serine/threonine protein kinase [Colletotrichum orchidophilum]|uniref:Serine/threonine protein kinase n=1 Tax=Colletotrichum orchidophilum TaxID=1209926 RepID=A0A1G4B3Q4_9PEZI|nr:serine/threonine protein kinase [Colletotrichum orchidophilum]OHE95973.1 serine/threonine protein kinase [Colletotrichum orchidophilum]
MSRFDYEKVSSLLSAFITTDEAKVAEIARFISPGDEERCPCENDVCTGLRIIFATLFLLGKQELILEIYQSSVRICDGAWPCSDPTSPTYSTRAAEALREVLRHLDAHEDELFHQLQWQMRSPYFRRGKISTEQPYRLLQDEVTLPWSELSMQGKILDGQVSFVQRIKIHQDHHELQAQTEHFALKILDKRHTIDAAETSFNDEIAANQRTKHSRITPLLAAFRHRNRFYLLFPWADGGSLLDLWKKHDLHSHFPGHCPPWYSVRWMIEQCYYIADALATVHGYDSREGGHSSEAQLHLDIKPENIVCFGKPRNGNISYELKLTDFGLSKPFDRGSPQRPRQKAETKTYRPPERDLEGTKVDEMFDIWCLGCLFLDFITWALEGSGGVERFRESRLQEMDEVDVDLEFGPVQEDTFFKKRVQRWVWWWPRQFSRTIVADLKPSVISQFQHLRYLATDEPDLERFLGLVQSRMLLIDGNARATSNEVRNTMHVWKQSFTEQAVQT